MRTRNDPTRGFVPPKGYKPRAEAHVQPARIQQRTLGPLLRAVADRLRSGSSQ